MEGTTLPDEFGKVGPHDFTQDTRMFTNAFATDFAKLNGKLEGISRKLELFESASVLSQTVLQAVTRIEEEQRIAFGRLVTLQETFLSTLTPFVTKDNVSLTDIDRLMKSNISPLSVDLDKIRMQSDSSNLIQQTQQLHNEQKQNIAGDNATVRGFKFTEQVTRTDLSQELGMLHKSLRSLGIDLKSDLNQSVVDLKGQQDAMMREVKSKMVLMEVMLQSAVPAPDANKNTVANIDEIRLAEKPWGERPSQATSFTGTSARPSIQPPTVVVSQGVTEPSVYMDEAADDAEMGAAEKIFFKEPDSMGAVFGHDDDVETEPYHVEDYYYHHGFPQRIARSEFFSNVTALVVCLNAIWIGVEADWNTKENLYDSEPVFQVGTQFFAAYFTIELFLRFLAFKVKRNAFRDSWFLFDSFLVATMILDVWVLMLITHLVSDGKKLPLPTQPLRILRLFKLTRMARLMRAFPELVTMIRGLMRSLRAIFSSLLLIMLMIYTWSIVLFMLMNDEDTMNRDFYASTRMDFTSVTNCMWLLMMDGALMLDNAQPIMTKLIYADKWHIFLAGAALLLFSLLSNLLILQMLIGVLCDVVTRVNDEQRTAQTIGLIRQELLKKLLEVDNGDGRISHDELKKVMNDPLSKAVLRKLKINRLFLYQMQAMLFERPGATVPIKACLEVMILCKAENPVTIESLAGGFCYVFRELEKIKKQLMRSQNQQMAQLSNMIAGSVSSEETEPLQPAQSSSMKILPGSSV